MYYHSEMRNEEHIRSTDRPKSYWIEHERQVLTYIREKQAQNAQREGEKKETKEDTREENPFRNWAD